MASRPWLAIFFLSSIEPCPARLPSLSSHFLKRLLIFPEYLRFSLISVIQTVKMHLFQKIIPEKFCQFGKM